MDRGLVYNIQRYCLHDGPGIRTTVFLQGCPLSCAWCHNPESRPSGSRVRVMQSRCTRCGYCVAACPQAAVTPVSDVSTIETAGERAAERLLANERLRARGDCLLCGACVAACPTGARQMLGREMSVDEVLAEVLRDRQFHDESGGGATLSGGEPLMQAAFVLRLLQALRDRSVHTVLDTCGFASQQTVLEMAPWVDLFLYDLKSVDDELHARGTGVSNQQILENLQALNSIHANIWIRVPLIPGFNLEPAHLEAAARYVAGLPAVRQVHLLPYHRMGTGKQTGSAVESAGGVSVGSTIAEITPEQIELAASIFRAVGLRTLIGG